MPLDTWWNKSIKPSERDFPLERGANPNARKIDRRTPLMEAASWGWLQNVKILIEHGADKGIECVRNGQRLRAMPLQANSEERYKRSVNGEENKNERD